MFSSNSLPEDKLGLCFAVGLLVTLKKDWTQMNGHQMEETTYDKNSSEWTSR